MGVHHRLRTSDLYISNLFFNFVKVQDAISIIHLAQKSKHTGPKAETLCGGENQDSSYYLEFLLEQLKVEQLRGATTEVTNPGGVTFQVGVQ